MKISLTALVITYNEKANISRTLDSLHWLPSIVVIDSGSTDGTIDIVKSYNNCMIISRPFDNFANQCNYGLDAISTTWVLSIDADFIVSKELAREIVQRLERRDSTNINGFLIPIRYCIGGHPIRGSIYPPRISLYRTSAGRYQNQGHGHRIKISGTVERLNGEILHDDRKEISRWLSTQQKYMAIEAKNLLETSYSKLSYADKLRKYTPLAPLAALFISLVIKGGLLDGWRGWTYAVQRAYAELLLLVILTDYRGYQNNQMQLHRYTQPSIFLNQHEDC